MIHPPPGAHEHYPDPHHDLYSRTQFGFWIYLLTDFVLFATIFATYAVLVHSTFGGPTAAHLFSPSAALWPAVILLISSWTIGLGGAAAHRKDKRWTLVYFSFTFVLGLIFLSMVLSHFSRLSHMGYTWDKSAFLSAYFTLVGTHAVHMVFALIWVLVLLYPLIIEEEVSHISIRRLTCLRMFWQFLNIIWVFIFSFVYLMGVV